MIGHDATWDEALLGLPVEVVPLVDWSTGIGQPWQPLRVISGGHAIDATQQTRWSTTGTFVSGDYPIGENGIHSKGCRMRVRQKITAMGFGSRIFPAGVYYVTSAVEAETNIQITGNSFEIECIDSTFPIARSFPSSSKMTLRQQAELLISEAVHDANFIWDERLAYNTPMLTMQVDSDRWGTIDGGKADASILSSIGGQAYCNSFGAFQFAPMPTLKDKVVGEIKRGETLIMPASTQDRTGVFNLVVVTGTPADGGPVVGPVFVWDNDPTSTTYAGPDPVNHPEQSGPYGVKPYRYDNPLIGDDKQGKTAGQGLLSIGLGVHEVITADAFFNPFYEADDVVSINGIPRLIDTVAITWGSAKMSLTTRSPKADLS